MFMDSVSPCSTRRLQVRLMSGRDLEEVNHRIQGLSDPFCRIRNLRTGEIFTSDPLSNTTNPNWHQSFFFEDITVEDVLEVFCFDRNVGRRDKFLGYCLVSVSGALAVSNAVIEADIVGSSVPDIEKIAKNLEVKESNCNLPSPELCTALHCQVEDMPPASHAKPPYSRLSFDNSQSSSIEALQGFPAQAPRTSRDTLRSVHRNWHHGKQGLVSSYAHMHSRDDSGGHHHHRASAEDFMKHSRIAMKFHAVEQKIHMRAAHLGNATDKFSLSQVSSSPSSSSKSCPVVEYECGNHFAIPSGSKVPGAVHGVSAMVPGAANHRNADLPVSECGNTVVVDTLPFAAVNGISARNAAFDGDAQTGKSDQQIAYCVSLDSEGMSQDCVSSGTLEKFMSPFALQSGCIAPESYDRFCDLIRLMGRAYNLNTVGRIYVAVMDARVPDLSAAIPRNKYKKFVCMKYADKVSSHIPKPFKHFGISLANVAEVPQSLKSTIKALHHIGKAYPTWKIDMSYVKDVFGDRRQHWDEDNLQARKIFHSRTACDALRVQHAVLYGGTHGCQRLSEIQSLLMAETGVISGGEEFLKLLQYGYRNGKPRMFTYVLQTERLYMAETGPDIFLDMNSKHAMHANGAEEVVYAGELHFRPVVSSDRRTSVCVVLDNKSGTYTPRKEDLPLLKEVFCRNFANLMVEVYDLDHPKLREYTEEIRGGYDSSSSSASDGESNS